MLELRPGTPGEIPAQKVLWKQAFGDDDRYIDDFYAHCVRPEEMLVLLEDGVLRSMLALLPVTVCLPDGTTAKAAYVYALATDPLARKQGFGRMLLQYVDFYLGEQGLDCVTVVPADAGLHRFFAAVGYTECFATRKIELSAAAAGAPAAAAVTAIGPAEYGALREKLLAGKFHADYDARLLGYQQTVCRKGKGDLYRVTVGEAEGVAAAERCEGDSVVIRELVILPDHIPSALSALAAVLPAGHYHLRTPAFWPGIPTSYQQPFAMIKWLSGQQRRTWGEETLGYFGLAFD